MKLLLFSDVHANVRHCQQMVNLATQVDVVVGAGDFGNLRRGIDIAIEVLRAIDKPAVLVPGNSESAEELKAVCAVWPTAMVLHGSGVEIEGIPFFGVGGGIPITPFGAWSYDFTEAEAADLLAPCQPNCVLVSHSPPKGAVDVSSGGRSLGSTAVRQTIEQVTPRLVVCGHIHESGGQQAMLGATSVVNAGPKGMMWEL